MRLAQQVEEGRSPSWPKTAVFVVGDASTPEGLATPYNEENTPLVAKIDEVPAGSEIIGRWHEKQNSDLYPTMGVELAQIIEDQT